MAMLTVKERQVLDNLQASAAKGMRSKPTQRVLSSLMAKGMIEYDPFAGTAKLTERGERFLLGPTAQISG